MSIEFPKTTCYRDIPIPVCSTDGERMPLVNHPDPSFWGYCGMLNVLDRDMWNNELSDRSFAVHHPPYNLINKPQSTSECAVPDCNPLVVSANPMESYAYWSKYNNGYSCDQTYGYPMYPNQSQQQMWLCSGNPTPVLKTELQLPTMQQFAEIIKEDPNKPWLCGIQKNIDVESKLFQLGFYNNRECYQNNLICNPEKLCADANLKETVVPTGSAMLSNNPMWNQHDMIYNTPPPSIYQRFNNLTRIVSICSRG